MKKMPRVLIVEDEPAIAELIAVNLRHNGFQPIWSEDGESAQRELDAVLPDVILLDWMLPGQSGLQLARKWRADARTKPVPILMLTARGDEPDKVAGLDAGADDYITKPFSTQEMLARIRAVLRRAAPRDEGGVLRMGALVLDPREHTVTAEGARVELTLKEFEVLRLLLSHPGMVFTRDQLLSGVWDMDYDGETRTVDVHIRTLRGKLGSCGDLIRTVRGVGYKMEGPGR